MVAARSEGARLTDLRELLQLTQKELASQTGIAQSAISAIERGDRELVPAMRAAVCAATRMPLSFFDFPAAPTDRAAVHFRKTAGASAKATKAALRYFEELQRISGTLAQRLGKQRFSLSAVPAFITGWDIETIAAETRDELGVERDRPVTHVIRAIERAGAAIAPLTRPGAQPLAFDGHSGMSRTTAEAALIMYTPNTAGDRQRFTVAHELGHLKLHSSRDPGDESTREKEAHRFAGAFLYPREAAERDISESLSLNGYARIKARWGVSIQALISRGRDLQLISPGRQRSLMIQVSSRGWRKSEPVDVGVEQPMLLWRMLSDLHGENPYMTASHQFGIDPERLELWIPNRASTHGGAGAVVPLFSGSRCNGSLT